MSSRTSAIRGLALVALSALGFAACENKGSTNVVVNPPASLNVTPAGPINLIKGQTAQLAASTGNFNSAGATVTYTSSVPAVASVSATGLVTALAKGTTTVTVKATGTDLNGGSVNLSSAVQVNVDTLNSTPGQTGGQPTVSIQSITNNAGNNVDLTNTNGQINVALNVDIPTGVRVDSIVTLINGQRACSQSFATGSVDAGVGAEAAEVPVTIVCPINTAKFDSLTNAVSYPNGQATISARLFGPGGNVLATANQALTLNNNNFVRATVTTSRGNAIGGQTPGPGNLAPAGSVWNAGSVTVTLNPIIYNGAANAPASATVTLTTSGFGVTGAAGCVPTNVLATDPTVAAAQGGAGAVGTNVGATPNCAPKTATQTTTTVGTNGTMTVVFPEANSITSAAAGGNGVKGVEDNVAIAVSNVTTAGQPGTVCVNPNPSTNPQNGGLVGGVFVVCGNGFAAPGANPLRLDNLGPRITNFDITPATLGCAPNASCYINSPASISAGFKSVDYGVDSQTTTFAFGTAGGTTAALPATFTAGPTPTGMETATSGSDVASATVVDKLGNSSGERFASAAAGTTVATSSSAGIQTFGVDVTAPTCAFSSTAPNVSANKVFNIASGAPGAGTAFFGTTFTDSATPPAGPSGFPPNPASTTTVLLTPAGTTCVTGTGGTACNTANVPGQTDVYGAGAVGTNTAVAAAAGTQGYYTSTTTIRDVAGNTCSAGSRSILIDTTAPAVGGIVAPSTISGNQSVTFSATATDNIDLGSAIPSETYGAVIPKLIYPTVVIDNTFGAPLTTSATVSFNDPAFIRSIETTTAGNVPSGAVQQATAVNLDVSDQAGNAAPTQTQNIAPNVAAGSPAGFPSFTAAGAAFDPATNPTGTFTFSATPTTICTTAAATAAATTCTTTQTTVLKASATGPASVFNNPFQRVNFYYNDAAGSHLIGTGAVSVTDNTITGIRTWSYTLSWTPSTLTAAGYPVFAVGVDATGSGLQSQPVTVTVTAP